MGAEPALAGRYWGTGFAVVEVAAARISEETITVWVNSLKTAAVVLCELFPQVVWLLRWLWRTRR